MSAVDTSRSSIGLVALGQSIFEPVQRIGTPLIDLAIRLMIARVFFLSGLTKINDWDNTLLLFEYEYMVPVLPVDLAAMAATFFELAMPVLIAIGLLTRFAVIPLFVMALVIQFVLGAANPAYNNIEHFYWMILLAYIFIRGAGPLSADHLAAGKLGIR
ncbi:MAG: DoxX family protein [Minwuia sp.]|uniref:DoxX family protein n=1 Tax=Minwuia sp. TaxID=2493630 RepID=UPI003A842D4F